MSLIKQFDIGKTIILPMPIKVYFSSINGEQYNKLNAGTKLIILKNNKKSFTCKFRHRGFKVDMTARVMKKDLIDFYGEDNVFFIPYLEKEKILDYICERVKK